MSWNPWRDARELRVELDRLYVASQELQRQCDLYLDRYDKIREMNLQLRDALELYRRV